VILFDCRHLRIGDQAVRQVCLQKFVQE